MVQSSGPAFLVSIDVDGRSLPLPTASGLLTIDTTALPDGPHLLRLTAEDRSLRRNNSTLDLPFTTDNTPPALSATFLAASDRLRAGQVTAARLTTSEPADLTATWLGAPLPLLPLAQPVGSHLAFLAAPVTSTTTPAPLTLTGRDAAGNVASHESVVAVEATLVPRQNLLVPASLAGLATGKVALEESAQLIALTSTVRPDRLWSGEFRPPLTGPRTTGFGDRRDYVDGHIAFHSGYDVAAPERAPVLAPAAGLVAHAGQFPQRGGTVIVDHGWGIYTLFAHLAEIHVAPGQTLLLGQTIGLVGSTGLSTGPHLHWEVRLRGQPVDPDSWIGLTRSLP